MTTHLTRLRVRSLSLTISFFILAAFHLQASASPGSYHTAVGTGTSSYEPGACTGGICHPEQIGGDPFSIDGSNKVDSYGSMMFKGVSIPLTCVAIQDVKDGHALYASGTGSDAKKYYAKVTATSIAGNVLISTSSGPNKCGAPEWYGTSGLGSFVIKPM